VAGRWGSVFMIDSKQARRARSLFMSGCMLTSLMSRAIAAPVDGIEAYVSVPLPRVPGGAFRARGSGVRRLGWPDALHVAFEATAQWL